MGPADRARRAALARLCALGGLCLSARAREDEVLPSVPYVATPQNVVDRMLELARVGPRDVVYDLGCGDGRIVISAAKRHGARGMGVDLDPRRIREAKAHALEAGVADRVSFVVGDLYRFDFSPATVVTLYLLPEVNRALRPLLWEQLKVGTRVVSHNYDMGNEWPPEHAESIDGHSLFSWTIRARHK